MAAGNRILSRARCGFVRDDSGWDFFSITLSMVSEIIFTAGADLFPGTSVKIGSDTEECLVSVAPCARMTHWK